MGPPDAILGITDAFNADNDPLKVNLGVGAYRDDAGKPYVLNAIKEAENRLLKSGAYKEYSGIAGNADFTKLAIELAYGDKSNALRKKRISAAQSISGTGALCVGASFMARFLYTNDETKIVYLPQPTWGNHVPIFRDRGFQVRWYRYFNKENNGIDLDGMLEDLSSAPQKATVLLHVCAHNPTGVDPSIEQWKSIERVVKANNLFPFFDMAYQGFATGKPEQDAWALRYFVDECGHLPIMAQSFAKNMGLYGERVGTVSVVCASEEEKKCVDSQLKILIRPMYSNPPIHGARLACAVLGTPELRAMWLTEVSIMADRIISMRSTLRKEIESLGSKLSWKHITDQIGMFCYTGMTPEQVDQITQNYHIYLTRDGRISLAGINASNVQHVARAIHAVTSSCDF